MPRMGLRARLAVFFVVITVIPSTVAVALLQLQVDRQMRLRSVEELEGVRRAAVALIELTRARAADLAADLVTHEAGQQLAGGDAATAQAWLDGALVGSIPARADLALLISGDGTVLAEQVTTPEFRDEVAPPGAAELASAVVRRETPPGVLLTSREVRGTIDGGPEQVLGWVSTAVWTDDRLLQGLGISGGAALVRGDQILAAGGTAPGGVPADRPASGSPAVETDIDGRPAVMSAAPLGSEGAAAPDVDLVVWSATADRTASSLLMVFVLLPSVLAAGLLGWLIAGTVIAPVERAAEVARAVAEGDLGRTLEPTGGRELAELASALNVMSSELDARMKDLERSRDQLRGSLARLGQTLSSSLDLNRTLSVVVETAMEALDAERGALMLFTPERDALYLKVGRGLDGDVPRLAVGEGLAGWVAQTGTPLRLPGFSQQAAGPAPHEPTGRHHLAVPMLGRGRVIGVLSLITDAPDRAFTGTDLDTMRSFAAQASVAVENVLLHHEAQRLSVTDPLTGLWNFRYFQLQADRELESAGRFERPLSLLVIDIDLFKEVNDRYGHQVGDEVLIEVARRLRDSTRVPDVVARYGGEEFVVLLPGTDVEGAVATAERIRAAVGGARMTVYAPGVTATVGSSRVDPLRVTCSLGVSAFPEHGRTVAGLLRSADAAMYAAKRLGRNRVMAAGPHQEELLDGRAVPPPHSTPEDTAELEDEPSRVPGGAGEPGEV
jgi:two-component system, cell cycle response regulator